MDCRSLLEEFEDLNNNPEAVYNQLSYTQQTSGGFRQIPYRCKLSRSSMSGLSYNERTELHAKALAYSSVIKTDAILAREAIKSQNLKDRVQKLKIRPNFKSFYNERLRLICSPNGSRNTSKEREPSVDKNNSIEFQSPPLSYQNERERATVTAFSGGMKIDQDFRQKFSPTQIRIISKRAANRDRNGSANFKKGAGLFSQDDKQRSVSPPLLEGVSPSSLAVDGFLDSSFHPQPPPKRPSTNLNSTLKQIYSCFNPKDVRISTRQIQTKRREAGSSNLGNADIISGSSQCKVDTSGLIYPGAPSMDHLSKVIVKRQQQLNNLLFSPPQLRGPLKRPVQPHDIEGSSSTDYGLQQRALISQTVLSPQSKALMKNQPQSAQFSSPTTASSSAQNNVRVKPFAEGKTRKEPIKARDAKSFDRRGVNSQNTGQSYTANQVKRRRSMMHSVYSSPKKKTALLNRANKADQV